MDRYSYEFEEEMMKLVTDRTQYTDIRLFINVHRMFFESLESQAFKDAWMLVFGYLIVFTYVLVMLGKLRLILHPRHVLHINVYFALRECKPPLLYLLNNLYQPPWLEYTCGFNNHNFTSVALLIHTYLIRKH